VFIHNLNFITNLKKEGVFTSSTKKKDFIFFRKNRPDIKIILAYSLISIVNLRYGITDIRASLSFLQNSLVCM